MASRHGRGQLIREITPRGFLSFAPDTPPQPLQSLNVLIGPNGSGKSNLMEAIAVARATPGDVRGVLRRGGGVREWVWKGEHGGTACLDLVVDNPGGSQPLRHVLEFAAQGQGFHLVDERIEQREPYEGHDRPYFFYQYQGGHPVVMTRTQERKDLQRWDGETSASILAQLRDADAYAEITYLAQVYTQVRLYREWSFGRNTVFRVPQSSDARNDQLEEDFSNLGLFLNQLRKRPRTKKSLLDHLRDLYDGLEDFDVSIEGGTVQVYFTEGDFTIPATRLSDGTLRYLCLLAILCDPEPPPLICLEEPELGLHPDLLPRIADLLVEASSRTQLIVTTHSDILVDAMTDRPECVIVCEKHEGRTRMSRLDPVELSAWLERYRLGQLWTRGEIGGTRW